MSVEQNFIFSLVMVFGLVAFPLKDGVPRGFMCLCNFYLTWIKEWSMVDHSLLLEPKTAVGLADLKGSGSALCLILTCYFVPCFSMQLIFLSVLLTLCLCFCFAAQQWCCECHKHIHGQHFCRLDAAGVTPKLTYVNYIKVEDAFS